MKTEYEKCLAGEPFIGGKDPKIVEMILRTRRLLAEFNSTDYADTKRRRAYFIYPGRIWRMAEPCLYVSGAFCTLMANR